MHEIEVAAAPTSNNGPFPSTDLEGATLAPALSEAQYSRCFDAFRRSSTRDEALAELIDGAADRLGPGASGTYRILGVGSGTGELDMRLLERLCANDALQRIEYTMVEPSSSHIERLRACALGAPRRSVVRIVERPVSDAQFSPAFGALPVLDYFPTPIGFLSTSTRRCGDNLWIRASDVIFPNAAQFGTTFVTGERERFALCAWLTRWIVPIDDVNCWTIGLRHFNDVIDPDHEGREDRIGLGSVDFMGQAASRSYAERQVNPGDYDAQVGQGPIAIHANEHLGSTDRGVALLRRMLQAGIRAAQTGEPIPGSPRDAKGVVPTFNHEVVLRVPARPGEDDRAMLREVGRRVAEIVIASAEEPPDLRASLTEARVRVMLADRLRGPG